jgi:hypothetical protein
LGRSDAVNPELAGLEQELFALYSKGALDAFGSYLYGVVLHEQQRKADARTVLCVSVNAYPWNWSAWLELQVRVLNLDYTTRTCENSNDTSQSLSSFILLQGFVLVS